MLFMNMLLCIWCMLNNDSTVPDKTFCVNVCLYIYIYICVRVSVRVGYVFSLLQIITGDTHVYDIPHASLGGTSFPDFR